MSGRGRGIAKELRGRARPSSLVVTKDQVIPAKCEGILMARLESPLGVECDPVEQSPKAHPPKGIYIARTLVQDRQEVPVRVLNATHSDQVLLRGFPLAHCESVTPVTSQCKKPNPETMKFGLEHQKVPG
jgi:hypothetical protein